MPSDSNGVYSLPVGYLAVTGEVIQATQHNPPLEDLASSMTQRLMRSGAAPMTGPLKAIDGSAGSPSVQFANAASTGMYKTATGIGFSVGGAQVAEIRAGGFVSGAHWIGELIPYTGLTAPALTVLAYGQNLSRATYPDLWTFAQAEIAAGNTFYNNGNGSTTFGIGDLRGRAVFGKDDMGGSAAGRIQSGQVSINGNLIGGSGGSATSTLITANLPAYTPSGTITNGSISINVSGGVIGGTNSNGVVNSGGEFSVPTHASTIIIGATQAASTFNGSAQGGTSALFTNMPPTMICNFLLFAGA